MVRLLVMSAPFLGCFARNCRPGKERCRGYTDRMPRLLIGPVLRHVGRTDATVWVETDAPCEVEVLGARERTWTVAGHHYALVTVEGLAPGSTTPYEVHLDGARGWPEDGSEFPPSRIRTPGRSRSFRIAFGSWRFSSGRTRQGSPGIPPGALNPYT